MLDIASGALLLAVTVTVMAALVVPTGWSAKVRLVGTSVTVAAGIPAPVNRTTWGLSGALSVTVSVPVRVPVAVGVKVTEIVQLAPAATLVPQVLV